VYDAESEGGACREQQAHEAEAAKPKKTHPLGGGNCNDGNDGAKADDNGNGGEAPVHKTRVLNGAGARPRWGQGFELLVYDPNTQTVHYVILRYVTLYYSALQYITVRYTT